MATLISVPNETTSSASRITKEGKKITYKLNVIQQPERARACGSGAKSSADRRPVDPPPIVELRVFEGSDDVTFSYNANFFLFATLENARTIAQGRVPQSPSQFPVLTGTPVAGMAYLDRPSPAGYFIFPDLSVRHEGKYRLSFSLFEELKEQKDMDTEEIQNIEILAQTSQHVSHRLEVKSQPFTVFSAKKFPGLTESTALSRMVAEQGCRVRIRRDVRMRRRETKNSKDDWDDYSDPDHTRQSRTPDAYGHAQQAQQPDDRPRSVSNASVTSYGMPQRRPSMEQMGGAAAYQQPYGVTTPTSQAMYSYPTSQAPGYPQAQPSAMMQPPQVPYQPPAPQFAPPPPPPPTQQQPVNYSMPQHQQQYSQAQQTQPQPAYENHTHHVRHSSMDYPPITSADYRRAGQPAPPAQYHANGVPPTTSAAYGQLDGSYPTTTQAGYVSSPTDMGYQANGWANTNGNTTNWSRRGTATSSAPQSTPAALAPIRTLPGTLNLQAHHNGSVSSSISSGGKLSPASPSYHSPLSAEQAHSPGYTDLHRNAAAASGGKRTYSATFDTHHLEGPLRYGARPPSHHSAEEEAQHHAAQMYAYAQHQQQQQQQQHAYGGGPVHVPPPAQYDTGSDGEPVGEENAMSYRRADGTERRRRIPAVN